MNNRDLYRRTFSKLHTSPDFHVEAKTMHLRKPIGSLLAAAILVAVLTCAAVAGMRFLTPAEAARQAGDTTLAAALEAPGALALNESQTFGSYTIDLLGVVSGENLSDFAPSEALDTARSYLVAAIRCSDGRSIETAGETGIQFSPLISGLDVGRVNAWTLSGGVTSFVQDGVEYIIFDCATLEPFADHTIYFAAYEGFVPNDSIFAMDPQTGEISFAEGYDGPGALFTIPLDSSKADSAAAEEILSRSGLS